MHPAARMNNVIYEYKFPGTKEKSSFLLNFIHPPHLILHKLSIQAPFKQCMIGKQSENETEPCNKENQLAWTKEVIKKHFFFNGGEYGINYIGAMASIGQASIGHCIQ